MIFETIYCSACSLPFQLPDYYIRLRKNDNKAFQCPSGHSQYYSEDKVKKLQEELAQEKSNNIEHRDVEAWQEKRIRAMKGVITKLRNKLS